MDIDPDVVTEVTAPVIMAINPEQLARVYIKIRNAKAAATAAYEAADKAFKDKLKMIENTLLSFLQENNAQSVKTDSGTFYRETTITPRGDDWNAFYQWVKENDAFDFLEKRIKRTEIKTFMETHDDTLPPGVSVFKEHVVRVRKNADN